MWNIQESDRSSGLLNTKWVFVRSPDVEVKTVLDRQQLLGTGPLPDWLRNLAHGRQMVALDTYNDNLCLQRCIAVDQGARADWSTEVARELAKSYVKLREAPKDVSKTSLDELDKVERHLNQGEGLSDWLGIRVYERECQENGEIVWHLTKNAPTALKKIITLGMYEEHASIGSQTLRVHELSNTFQTSMSSLKTRDILLKRANKNLLPK